MKNYLLTLILIIAGVILIHSFTNASISRNKHSQENSSIERVAAESQHLTATLEPSLITTPIPTAVSPLNPQSVLNDGTLRVHPTNPRYFTDDSGRVIYLAGSHHWDSLIPDGDRDPNFDYTAYLDFLEAHNHNFMRLWMKWAWLEPLELSPYRYAESGTTAEDRAKFDLSQFNQEFFDRLRARVIEAGERDIYVSVMLFQGWNIKDRGEGNPWPNHPYNGVNNTNGIEGDLNGNGEGEEIHTLASPEILALQEAYVRRVIDTLNDLDHVMYEISNESPSNSADWQYHMVDFIRSYEATKPQQHLVGISGGGGRDMISNEAVFASPADWVAPNYRGGYRNNSPGADGNKVIIADTDHISGVEEDGRWVWQTFMRGLHPIYMDDFGPEPWKVEARVAMGQTLAFAQSINLAEMRPLNHLASTRFCLASPTSDKAEYLVYLPEGGTANVNLTDTSGLLVVQWFNPETGQHVGGGAVVGGKHHLFSAPFSGQAVLYLKLIIE